MHVLRYGFLVLLSIPMSLGGCPSAFSTPYDAILPDEGAETTTGGLGGGTPSATESAGSGEAGAGESSGGSEPGTGLQVAPDVQRVFDLVNEERAAAGLSPLALNAKLNDAAQAHAESMYEEGYFSHTGSDGSTVADRVERFGYAWSTVGENIAYGATSPEQVMQMWMNSSGHRANILGSGYTEMGVGIDTRGAMWVQVFARPQSAGN